jgi:hypothetical protein
MLSLIEGTWFRPTCRFSRKASGRSRWETSSHPGVSCVTMVAKGHFWSLVPGGAVGDTCGHRKLVHSGGGWCNADDGDVGRAQGGAVGAERGGLAGATLAHDDVEPAPEEARARTMVCWCWSKVGWAARTWSTIPRGMRATPACRRRPARSVRCTPAADHGPWRPSPRHPRARRQPTAVVTSSTTFSSTAGVHSRRANAVGHIAPSSSRAGSLKPKVEYRVENFCEPWKKHTTLPSLA